MKNKILMCLIVLFTLFLSFSLVSASENATGVMQDDDAGETLAVDNVDNFDTQADENNDSPVNGEDDVGGDLLAADGNGSGDTLSDDDSGDAVLGNGSDDTLSGDDSGDVVLGNGSGDTPKPKKVVKKTSRIISKDFKNYATFSTKITAKLIAGGKGLKSTKVKIVVDGKTYTRKTNKDGKLSLTVTINKKGTYKVVFSYAGDSKTKPTKLTTKLYLSAPTKTYLKIGDKDLNYRAGSNCLFYVKLVDDKNKAIKDKWIVFKVTGKTFKAKTDNWGNAAIHINVKQGPHRVTYYFAKKAPYAASNGAFKIYVRPAMPKGDGYWLWPMHMKGLNLKSLADHGTKHLFLHAEAVSAYGKSTVVSFINNAHRYGIKVHLWMQVCCVGESWTSPTNKDGSIKYWFLNKKINEAKSYAKIKGVDGIHFDYVRYGGTAHNYKNPDRALNYFSRQASSELHKINSNCIVSAALMPEPSMMMYYYGQNVREMSKYMDVLMPMVYKGNYHQNTPWIKSVTNTFAKQSNGAQIWTGLQSYYSDNNVNSLPHSVLLKDAKAAKEGGAKGIVLFRIGISCNFNFKWV